MTKVHLWENDLEGTGATSIQEWRFVAQHRFTEDEQQLVLSGLRLRTLRNPQRGAEIRRLALPDLSRQETFTVDREPLVVLNSTGTYGAVLSVQGDTLQVVNASSGKTLARLSSGDVTGTGQVSFSPDNRSLVTVQNDGTVRVLSIPSGKEQSKYLTHLSVPIGVDIRPEEQRIVVAGQAAVQVWTTRDSPGLDLLAREGTDSNRRFRPPVVEPSGRYAAHVDSAGVPHLYGLGPDAESKTLQGHGGDVVDLEFGPDGETVATSEEDGTVRLWNLQTGSQQSRFDHSARVDEVYFAGDGSRIVTLVDSAQGSIRRREVLQKVVVWNVSTRQKLVEVDSVNGFGPAPVHMTPNRSHILITRDPELSPSEQRGRPETDSVLIEVRNAATGNREALFGEERRIENLITGRKEAIISSDGRYALARQDSSVSALNLENGQVFTLHDEAAYEAAFSPDGKRVALFAGSVLGGIGGLKIPLFNMSTQEQKTVLQIPAEDREQLTGQLQFGPEGHKLAATTRLFRSSRLRATVWHFPSSRFTPTDPSVLPAHRGSRSSLQFSKDGSYLLTAGEKEARLFGAEEDESTYL